MQNDIICPSCKKIFGMKNICGFEDTEMKMLGIIYIIECQFCKRQFVSNMRMGRKLNKRDSRKLINELRTKIDI